MLRHYKALSLCAAVVATAVSVAVAVAPANAKSKQVVVTAQRDMPVRRVSYRDLNLTAAQDRKLLFRRVGRAVVEVCDETAARLKAFDHGDACRSSAWNGARPQISKAISRARKMAALGGATSQVALAVTISAPVS